MGSLIDGYRYSFSVYDEHGVLLAYVKGDDYEVISEKYLWVYGSGGGPALVQITIPRDGSVYRCAVGRDWPGASGAESVYIRN